jgi:hypothetical protein
MRHDDAADVAYLLLVILVAELLTCCVATVACIKETVSESQLNVNKNSRLDASKNL